MLALCAYHDFDRAYMLLRPVRSVVSELRAALVVACGLRCGEAVDVLFGDEDDDESLAPRADAARVWSTHMSSVANMHPTSSEKPRCATANSRRDV